MKKGILHFLALLTLYNIAAVGNCRIFEDSSTFDSVKVIEKVYLHTDRDFYSPGDNIWFKAYLIDATDRILTDHSNNLHVELMSPDLKIILSRTVRMDSGLGNGDFVLGKELKSGKYWIRAYTNYMRNSSDSLFFIKGVFIVSPAENDKLSSDSAGYISNKIELGFYPESGSLTDGVESVVAFKAVNPIGNGCDVDGIIYSSAGDSITSFRSTHKGMGKFKFTPVLGKLFYAVVKDGEGIIRRFELPGGLPVGVVLEVSENGAGVLKLQLRTNSPTLSLVREKDLTLSVSARNILIKTVSFRLTSFNNYFLLKTDDLPDGIISLRLSGINDLPLCERLVYIHNRPDLVITVRTDKAEYKQRDSVMVNISQSKDTVTQRSSYLSLSAVDTASVSVNKYASTICSWFLLESDVRGFVEEPSFYFDPSNRNRFEDLDLVLMTNGWRDFRWKYEKMVFPPENGFTFSGRVRKLFSDVPMEGAKVTAAIFTGDKPLIITGLTNNSGGFRLDGLDFSGKATIIASVMGKNGTFQGWLIPDTNKYSSPEVTSSSLRSITSVRKDSEIDNNQHINIYQSISNNLIIYRKYTEIRNSVLRKYKLSDTINPGEVTIVVKHDDFPKSIAVRSRQYIMAANPDMSLAITRDLEAVTVRQILSNKFAYILTLGVPLVLLDGIPVGIEGLNGLPGSIIERIDYIKAVNAGVFGGAAINGVISVVTKDDWGDLRKPSYSSVKINLSGFDEPRVFYSPKHYTTLVSDYKPDMRTTLFWEPNLTLRSSDDLDLKFFNGDRSSAVRISVEGITSDGIPVIGKAEYEVK